MDIGRNRMQLDAACTDANGHFAATAHVEQPVQLRANSISADIAAGSVQDFRIQVEIEFETDRNAIRTESKRSYFGQGRSP